MAPPAKTEGWEIDCRWSSTATNPFSSRASPAAEGREGGREGGRERGTCHCCAGCFFLINTARLEVPFLPLPLSLPSSLPSFLPTRVLEPRRWLSLRAPYALVVRKRTPVLSIKDAGQGGGGGRVWGLRWIEGTNE